MACPFCRSNAPGQELKFTWWGGVLGPRLLKHVKCPDCGKGYNGQTGQPNTTAITVYVIIVGVVAAALFYALSQSLRP